MANIKRVRCELSGTGVTGPAVSTFYFSATASGFSADLQTFYQAVKGNFPSGLQIDVPNTGDLIDETNGVLVGVWTDSGGSSTAGTGSTNFSLGNGLRVKWVTGGIRGDRRVIGSTFLVPAVSAAFTTGGLVAGATSSAVTAAASALVSAQGGDMLIWGKPHSKVAADGESNAVLAGFCSSTPTQLRSRRV